MGGSPIPLPAGTSFLPTARVREIIGWSGEQVNGLQVVYSVGGETVRGSKRMGDHGMYRQSRIVLDVEGGEVRRTFRWKRVAALNCAGFRHALLARCSHMAMEELLCALKRPWHWTD